MLSWIIAAMAIAAVCAQNSGDSSTPADAQEHALSLGKDTFNEVVGAGPAFVKFYAPWCGHCKHLAQPWSDFARDTHASGSAVKIAKVDCTVHTELCSEHGIRGYPTLKFFKDGSSETYSGIRSVAAFSEFVNSKVAPPAAAATEEVVNTVPDVAVPENGLYTASDATFTKTIATGLSFVDFFAPWCGHCKTLAPMFSQVAEAYADNRHLKIVKVDCTVESLCQNYKIQGYPTLVLFKDGSEVERYQGGRSVVALTEYLQRQLAAHIVEVVQHLILALRHQLFQQTQQVPESVEVINGLKVLSSTSFEAGVAHGYTLVKMYAPWCGHCKRLAPVWDELAAKFAGHATASVAKLDCTLYQDICQNYQVQGYPTIFLFKDGKKIAAYPGARDLASLAAYLTDSAEGKHDEL